MSYLTARHKRGVQSCTAHYKEAERLTGVPWKLTAAIHYRENDNQPSSPRPGGAMQKDPPWTAAQIKTGQAALGVPLGNPETDVRTSILLGAWFIQSKLNPQLAPGSPRAALLQAAYRYNGTGYGDINLSPYVYNDPQRGKTLNIRGTLLNADGSRTRIDRPDGKGGVNAILDELDGVSPSPATPAAANVFYPLADWPRVNLRFGGYLSSAYRQERNAEHPGQDMNIGSGNADRGEPVYAVADGEVVYAGWQKTWGNIILIKHPQYGVWSQYAHVENLAVTAGQLVAAGSQIGVVGIGDPAGNFTAHLHFEIRLTDMPAGKWPGLDRAFIERNYTAPVPWLTARNARSISRTEGDLHPALVRVRSELIARLRVIRPDVRLVTTRTYDPPLASAVGPATPQAVSTPNRGPHSVRPALAFDFALTLGAGGAKLPSTDPLYSVIGSYAETRGGRWGPKAEPRPALEPGNLRNHIQLPNTEAALQDAAQRTKAGLIPTGSVDGDAAAQGSDPATEEQNRRNLCPAPTGGNP